MHIILCMKSIAYARVSSQDQNLDSQISEIKRYCDYRNIELIRIFTDKASGKNTDRPGFIDMMKVLEHNTFGIESVIVFKIDRIGRSLRDLIQIIETFGKCKIQFISITDNIDTTTNQGILFFQIIGAIAEYERKLINERSELGTRLAKERGVKWGRPKKVLDFDAIKMDLQMGIPKSKICKKYGIGRTWLYKKLDEMKL